MSARGKTSGSTGRVMTPSEVGRTYAAFALDFCVQPETFPVFRAWLAASKGGQANPRALALMLGESRETVGLLARLNMQELHDELRDGGEL